MKKIFYLLLIFTIVSNYSCTNEDLTSTAEKEFIYIYKENTQKLFPQPGTGEESSAEIFLVYHGTQESATINYTYEILETSTAIEGTHYNLSGTSGSFNTSTFGGELPITVIPDNLVLCEDVSLDVRLVTSDASETKQGIVTFILGVAGKPLSGTVDYTHTANFGGADLSGTIEITAGAVAGEYIVDDLSFGAWPAFYGAAPPSGDLRWTSNCGKISFVGADNYGDTWQFDAITNSDGPEFTFSWSNTYGEFGVVTLTRQDGENWPFLEP